MGTSLAITGAYVLAGELSTLLSDQEHPAKAFSNFESTFRPFVDKTQQIPFFVPAVVHPETAWKRWLLQSIISVGAKIANIQWIAGLFAQSSDTEDFVLPKYAKIASDSEMDKR